MSKSINMVVLTGRVGDDPKLMEGQNYKVARFRMATSEGGYKRQDGTDVPEKTYWHNIVAWSNLASLSQYIHKGDLVTVTGQLTYNEWETQNGEKKVTAEIVANNLVPQPKPRDNSQPYAANSQPYTNTRETIVAKAKSEIFPPDDLPF